MALSERELIFVKRSGGTHYVIGKKSSKIYFKGTPKETIQDLIKNSFSYEQDEQFFSTASPEYKREFLANCTIKL